MEASLGQWSRQEREACWIRSCQCWWPQAICSESTAGEITRLHPVCQALGACLLNSCRHSANLVKPWCLSLPIVGFIPDTSAVYWLLGITLACTVILGDFSLGHIILIYRMYTGCLAFWKRPLRKETLLTQVSVGIESLLEKLEMPGSRFYTTIVSPLFYPP